MSNSNKLNKSKENARAKKKDNAKAQADRLYEFTLPEAEAYAEVEGSILGLIMVANLKFNGWYACKVDGVKVFFEKVEKHIYLKVD